MRNKPIFLWMLINLTIGNFYCTTTAFNGTIKTELTSDKVKNQVFSKL